MQDKMTYLRIMLTQDCNLSCAYCHREGVGKLESRLDPMLALKIIKACYIAGMRKFKFIGGEPTLYSDLPSIIEEMSWPDVDISLISNGLFDQSFLAKCLDAGLDRVNISIHAWDSPKSMLLSGMGQNQLDDFFDNIEFLLAKQKVCKFNYVFLRGADRTELFSIIDWINRQKQTLDILNVLYPSPDSKLSDEYCDFEEIRSIITQNYGLTQSLIHDNAHSLPSERLYLEDGGVINLKKFTLNTFLPFNCCNDCHCREICREGILAMRLSLDACLQPCLLRTDNRLDLSELAGYSTPDLANSIASYISAL